MMFRTEPSLSGKETKTWVRTGPQILIRGKKIWFRFLQIEAGIMLVVLIQTQKHLVRVYFPLNVIMASPDRS